MAKSAVSGEQFNPAMCDVVQRSGMEKFSNAPAPTAPGQGNNADGSNPGSAGASHPNQGMSAPTVPQGQGINGPATKGTV